jgi:hypothetical protein
VPCHRRRQRYEGRPGTLSLGSSGINNTYLGGTYVDAGRVQIVSAGAFGAVAYSSPSSDPDPADLTVDDTGVVDLNGQSITISSLNSSYAAPGSPDGEITNGGTQSATLAVAVGGTPGVFGGSIIDGAGTIALDLYGGMGAGSSAQGLVETLTGQNTYTGGTSTDAALQIGDGTTDGSIAGSVGLGTGGAEDSDLIFDVAAGTTEVFNGNISGVNTTAGVGSVVVTGGGTLELTGDTLGGTATGNDFINMRVVDGTLQMGDRTALLSVSTVIVDAGGILDLNGNTPANTIPWISLNGGNIIDSANSGATIDATGLVELESGTISADLTGAGTVLKSDDPVGDTIAILAGADSLTGSAEVIGGTLEVNGTLDSPSVYVSVAGTLAGCGTCTGGVFIDPDGTGGTLDMDASIGPALTIASLTLGTLNGGTASPALVTEAENGQTGLLETANITGALEIYGGSVGFPSSSYPNFQSFQTLFQYGSETGFANLSLSSSAPNGAQLINDTAAPAIELASTANVLYWAPDWTSTQTVGGNGAWNTAGAWLAPVSGVFPPPSGTLGTNWQDGDVAVFDGNIGAVALGGFTAAPSEIVFLTGTGTGSAPNMYTISSSVSGGLSLPANASVAADSGVTAEISANMAPGILNTQVPGATLILDGKDANVTDIDVFGAGTLQLGNGSLSNTLPAAKNGQKITFDNTSAAPAWLAFEPPAGAVESFAGNISGNGGLKMEGANATGTLVQGVVTLSGMNKYSGVTAVWSGELEPTVAVALPSGGELQIGENAAISFAPVWPADAVHALEPAGVFGVGSEIDIAVPFAETVFVTGTPELALSTGATTEYAQYISGSGTSTLVFRYIVQPGDSSPALDYAGNNALLLNGGTIDNSAGSPVALGLATPLSNYETLDIDTVAPVVSSIAAIGPATTTAGLVQFAVTFSKPVYNVDAADFSLAGSGVTGDIQYVTGGGTQFVVTVDNLSGSGTLGLDLADNSSIVDAGGNPLGGGGSFSSGPVFLIVSALPGTLTGGAVSGVEYSAVSGMLASFTDTRGLGYTASEYSAEVYWGDGSQTSEPVTFNSTTQQFEIDGSHSYTANGNYTAQVFISDPNGLISIVDATATIADAPLTAGTLPPPPMIEEVPFNTVQLFHFTDANPNAVASEFTAVISWGDGTFGDGQIVADPNGGFDVLGSHTYGGVLTGVTLSVTVTDAGGASCTASQSGLTVVHAPLIDATLYPPQSSGNATFSHVALFSFVDTTPYLSDLFNNTAYSATVNWGDGSQTTYVNTGGSNGAFVRNGNVVTLYGSHTYTSALTVPFSVVVQAPYGTPISLSDATLDGGTLGFLANCVVTQPIAVSSGASDYVDTDGFTVYIAGAVTGDSSTTLDVIGGGKVYFADASGFAGTLISGGSTSYYTSPTATYTTDGSVAAASLSGLVVVNGCTLTLTGSGAAAPDVLVLENGGTVNASAVDAAIVSMTGGNSSLAANLGAGATVLVQGANYYDGSSAADIVLAQGSDLYANAALSGALKGLGNLHDWNGLDLFDNEAGFIGNYDFDGGSFVNFYTSALSGQANLNVSNSTYVAFFGSGNLVFAFGNLSGEAGPIDLSYNGDDGPGGYTLLINETGTTTVTGLLGDVSYTSTVEIAGGGNLTWDVQGESGYPVYTLIVGIGTTATFDYDTTATEITFNGNVTNNGTLIASDTLTVNGLFTNNGTVQCNSLVVNATGDFENAGTVSLGSGSSYIYGTYNDYSTTTVYNGTLHVSGILNETGDLDLENTVSTPSLVITSTGVAVFGPSLFPGFASTYLTSTSGAQVVDDGYMSLDLRACNLSSINFTGDGSGSLAVVNYNDTFPATDSTVEVDGVDYAIGTYAAFTPT